MCVLVQVSKDSSEAQKLEIWVEIRLGETQLSLKHVQDSRLEAVGCSLNASGSSI